MFEGRFELLKINMGAHKGCRCRNGTILGISLILIFSSARMALAAENAVKQAETAVIVGYSVSFIDAENTNHLIFHTQTGKVLEGTSLNVSFPEQIIGSDGHIWKSAVQSPQIFVCSRRSAASGRENRGSLPGQSSGGGGDDR